MRNKNNITEQKNSRRNERKSHKRRYDREQAVNAKPK